MVKYIEGYILIKVEKYSFPFCLINNSSDSVILQYIDAEPNPMGYFTEIKIGEGCFKILGIVSEIKNLYENILLLPEYNEWLLIEKIK